MRILPEALTRNGVLKLAALFLAVLLWTAVRVESPSRQQVSAVPVRIDLNDQMWVAAAPPLPSSIDLRVSGPTREILRLAANPPVVVIPIDEVTNPDTTLVIAREWVRMPGDPAVIVDDVQPSSVRLSFEQVETRVLAFDVRMEGELPDGLALAAQPTTQPSGARVSGRAGALAEMSVVPLLPIDMDRVDTTGAVSARVDTSATRGVQVSPLDVQVVFRIEPAVERLFASVPVVAEVDDSAFGVAVGVAPSTVDVIVRGARTLIENIDRDLLLARVLSDELNGLDNGPVRAPFVVDGLPPFTRILSRDSVTVTKSGEG